MKQDTAFRGIVLGDIHGELDGFREVLRHAGLAGTGDNWTGGTAILIQVGDVIDRGPESAECVALIRKLQKEALQQGGKVIRLTGNHELMLIQGNFSHVNFDGHIQLMGELIEEIAQGSVLASWTDGCHVYSHAGICTELRKSLEAALPGGAAASKDGAYLRALTELINTVFREAVKNSGFSAPIFYADAAVGGTDPYSGIFWCRFGYLLRSEGADAISQIVGHTSIRSSEIAANANGRLMNIDCGMYRGYGGHRVYLEIDGNGLVKPHSLG